MARKGIRFAGLVRWPRTTPGPPHAEGVCYAGLPQVSDTLRRMDVHLAVRLRKLVASGCSIRSAARELGVSRSAAMRAVSAAPVIDLADAYDEDDDYDEAEEVSRIGAMGIGPTVRLVPPFTLVGLVETLDGRGKPPKDSDGKPDDRPSLLWRDVRGRRLGELDMYRWEQDHLNAVDPFDYEARRAAEREAEEVKRHAWAQVYDAGISYDRARRRYVQRPRAV